MRRHLRSFEVKRGIIKNYIIKEYKMRLELGANKEKIESELERKHNKEDLTYMKKGVFGS